MNKKKFINKETGEIRIARIYQKIDALNYMRCPTYSQIHRTMKLMGFLPRSS